MLSLGKKFYHEFGLGSLYETGLDSWLIILARCCRMFAYGANSLILALFFAELDFSDWQIGLFMTLTLAGDVLLSLLLTLIADQVGRRRTLFAGSVLMVLTGAAFALSENFWILLAAAIVGVLSATGSDFGPFRAVEESMLSQLTDPKTRPDVLTWYVTTGSLGSAIGTEIFGRVIEWLRSKDGWKLVDAYHTCFLVYSGMGVINMLLSVLLSSKCEIKKAETTNAEESGNLLNGQDPQDSDAEDEQPEPQQEPKVKSTSRFSQISSATRTIMIPLWALLMLDSLADGMVPFTLTNYYLDQKFHMPKSTLGDITSASYLLAACSTIFAGPLSRRLGLVKTMVFTHVPSSTAVLLFPLPQSVVLTVILLFIRVGLNNMDQAPRSALIAGVVKPEERTAVMGITAVLRTLAATTGPSVTGILAGNNRFWIAFIAAGALRLAYDLGLFVMFVNIKLHKHEEKSFDEPLSPLAESRPSNDEEVPAGR